MITPSIAGATNALSLGSPHHIPMPKFESASVGHATASFSKRLAIENGAAGSFMTPFMELVAIGNIPCEIVIMNCRNGFDVVVYERGQYTRIPLTNGGQTTIKAGIPFALKSLHTINIFYVITMPGNIVSLED